MTIRLYCRGCQARIKIPDTAAGKKIKCPRCGLLQQAPMEGSDAPAPQEVAGESRPETPATPVETSQSAPAAATAAETPASDELDPLAALAAAAGGDATAPEPEAPSQPRPAFELTPEPAAVAPAASPEPQAAPEPEAAPEPVVAATVPAEPKPRGKVASLPTPQPSPSATRPSSSSASTPSAATPSGGPRAIPLSAHPSAVRPSAKPQVITTQETATAVKPPAYMMLVVFTWLLRTVGVLAVGGGVRFMLALREHEHRLIDQIVALMMGLIVALIAFALAEGLYLLRKLARRG